ncbi:MAG: hypothetical protein AMXMBFR33_19500 [Candidatus Xenobia bacterium]
MIPTVWWAGWSEQQLGATHFCRPRTWARSRHFCCPTATCFDESLKPGRVFERILLSGRPAQPLVPGRHTLEIVARSTGYTGSGPGLTRVVVEFTVGKGHDDDCDRREDDARDWEQD